MDDSGNKLCDQGMNDSGNNLMNGGIDDSGNNEGYGLNEGIPSSCKNLGSSHSFYINFCGSD